jgi:hypothetical protein
LSSGSIDGTQASHVAGGLSHVSFAPHTSATPPSTQQSESALHPSPMRLHVLTLQAPPSQSRLQQSTFCEQRPPMSVHA